MVPPKSTVVGPSPDSVGAASEPASAAPAAPPSASQFAELLPQPATQAKRPRNKARRAFMVREDTGLRSRGPRRNVRFVARHLAHFGSKDGTGATAVPREPCAPGASS